MRCSGALVHGRTTGGCASAERCAHVAVSPGLLVAGLCCCSPAGAAGKHCFDALILVLSQAAWLAVVPADMAELLRVSALKSFRGCQALVRLFIEVCCSIARHRCVRPRLPGPQACCAALVGRAPHACLAECLASWPSRALRFFGASKCTTGSITGCDRAQGQG